MFCRASVALWACHWNTWACAHPPHCPPERQKLDLSDKLSPLQRTLWKCVHCKRLLNLSCGGVTVSPSCFSLYLWTLLGVPAPWATCSMLMGLQVTVAASEWYLVKRWWWREKHMSAEYLAPQTCLSWTLYLHWALPFAHHPPFLLGQRCSAFLKNNKST